jgi:hypothetical protein
MFLILMVVFSFQFNTFAAITSEYEPNNTFYTAQEIKATDTVKGFITEAEDVDVFKFRATHLFKDSTAKITLSNIASNCDYDLVVYNEFEEEIARSVKASNSSEELEVTLEPGMWYYVKVYSYYGVAYKPYKFQIDIQH